MNIKKINHIGIVVRDLNDGIKKYSETLGLYYDHTEHNEDFDCDIAFLNCGDVLIELVEPHGPSASLDFLNEKGEGINHICYEVENIADAFREAKSSDLTDYDKPLVGAGDSRVFFLRDEKLNNVTTEIVQLKR